MNGLEIRSLHKGFGASPVLEGLDLDLPAGGLTAILGASGSGKTTLLRLLAGFERPDRGTIRIGTRLVEAPGTHVAPEQRRIGYVPQEGALFPHLNVERNIAFGLSRAERRRGVGELLEMVGLAGLARRYPHQLSGGQQQRVALARALAVRPEVVLLDEPFASLDAHQRALVREEVGRILREAAATTLLVTHDQDEALSLADLVAVLRDGTIAQCATPRELYAQPLDHELARFVGDANLIEGVLRGERVRTPLGELEAHWDGRPLPAASPVTALVRPEQIELAGAGEGGGLPGRVIKCGFHGHDVLMTVELEEVPGPLQLTVRTPGGTELPAGAAVTVRASGRVYVWPARSSVAAETGRPLSP